MPQCRRGSAGEGAPRRPVGRDYVSAASLVSPSRIVARNAAKAFDERVTSITSLGVTTTAANTDASA